MGLVGVLLQLAQDLRAEMAAAGAVLPIGTGGGSEAAYRRGVEKGDGFQVIGVTPDEAAPVIEPRELVATAPDGHPVHGWAFVPAGAGPHPVLLLIHGGPFGAYGPSFFDEAQVLAGAGYAVVLCNPRGSAGYGEAHAQAIQGGFGTLDADDVLAFLDHALRLGAEAIATAARTPS